MRYTKYMILPVWEPEQADMPACDADTSRKREEQ